MSLSAPAMVFHKPLENPKAILFYNSAKASLAITEKGEPFRSAINLLVGLGNQ